MAKSIEERLLEKVITGISDMRFNLHQFGMLATSETPNVRSRIFALCTAFIEMYAIHADHGDYDSVESRNMNMARELRDVIVRRTT